MVSFTLLRGCIRIFDFLGLLSSKGGSGGGSQIYLLMGGGGGGGINMKDNNIKIIIIRLYGDE